MVSCPICDRPRGVHENCHDGVLMDDDTYHDGWQPDVIYPPCGFNPACCQTCGGSGDAPPMMALAMNRDDCVDCHGVGWKDGKCQWPTPADELEPEQT